jgi:pyridoxine/pyridoxamine 5'-phosphate oxidase
MRLCTVASVDEENMPDARLLILRGASERHQCVWFHADCRSRKIGQIRRCTNVCIVNWDRRDGVALRLRGAVTVRLDDEVADQHWAQVEIAARHAYGLALPPGAPINERDPRFERAIRDIDHDHEIRGRENFAVLEVRLEVIEWMQVTDDADRRAIMRRDRAWEVEALAP